MCGTSESSEPSKSIEFSEFGELGEYSELGKKVNLALAAMFFVDNLLGTRIAMTKIAVVR